MNSLSLSFRSRRVARGAALSLALAGACLLGTARDVRADVIAVPNFSFEQDVIASDGSAAVPSNWTTSGTARAYNPPATRYTNADGRNTPTGGDGAQSAYVQNIASMQSAALLTTIQSNTRYDLVFALGNLNGVTAGTLRSGFLVGDAFVSGGDSIFDSTTVAAGTFADRTFSYTASTADIGKTLKIYFGQTSTTNASTVGFDNVRLSSAAVMATPEPSTWAMMFLGVGAMVLVTRRKRDVEV